jgi:dopamine beta-monooxygenase
MFFLSTLALLTLLSYSLTLTINQTSEFSHQDSQVYKMNLGFVNFELPADQETLYMCKYFNISSLASQQTGMLLNTKYHAIEYEPHVEHHVHHMLLLGCPAGGPREGFTNEPFPCNNSTEVMKNCHVFEFGWAPGRGKVSFPQETGIVWGTGETKVALLQIHYHNPTLQSGHTDSSNITVSFTPKLRQYDTGMMVLGRGIYSIEIPPGEPNYPVHAMCGSNCTSKMDGNITVYGFIPHGHMTSRNIGSDFMDRTGNNLTSLRDANFSFVRQVLNFVKPFTLEPGFSANTTCVYDTSQNTTAVHGGESSHDEMCFNFILYYPKRNGLAFCLEKSYVPEMNCVKNTF